MNQNLKRIYLKKILNHLSAIRSLFKEFSQLEREETKNKLIKYVEEF